MVHVSQSHNTIKSWDTTQEISVVTIFQMDISILFSGLDKISFDKKTNLSVFIQTVFNFNVNKVINIFIHFHPSKSYQN